MAGTILLAEAHEQVLRCGGPLEAETVSLEEALGRRLAFEIRADTPWPTTDRSAMDGFGVRAGSDSAFFSDPLKVVGASLAGHPFAGELGAGQAIRIMTGAVVPPSVDAVVPVENTSGYEGDTVTLRLVSGAAIEVTPR